MRLRWRVRVAIGGSTIVILAAISWATFSFFSSAEARELDRELLARVQHEASYLVHSEGIVKGGTLRIGALDDHVKYAALYDKDGNLIARTPTFEAVPAHASLSRKGPFDLFAGERHLRAVLWPLDDGELLLAASREELDADLRDLRRLLMELFVLGALMSIVAAGWIGSRLTRSIEHLAMVAQKIGAGRLETRVSLRTLGAPEVVALGHELNHMVDSLQSALTAQRRFVSNAAHELRSPLTVLLGELQLALRRDRSPDDYRVVLNELLGSVQDLHRLAEDLLDLAKGAQISAEQSELSSVLEAAIKASNCKSAAARGVSIVIDAPHSHVHGRAIDLARLFRNLIDNAVAHAPDGTSVRIQTQVNGGVKVSVEDDGAGVNLDMQSRIFEPFVRGGEERTTSGAGLGLAIANEIAKSVGGTLTLASPRSPTRFVVALRLSEQ